MEVLPAEFKRAERFERLGMEFLDEAVAKNKELPGIEWPNTRNPTSRLRRSARCSMIYQGGQEIVRNLGMRRFTAPTRWSSARRTAFITGVARAIEATDQQPRTPEDAMDYPKAKLVSEKLTHIALRYMKCMCAGGQHNELL